MNICERCNKRFKSRNGLIRHQKSAHGISPDTASIVAHNIPLGSANGHISLTTELMRAMKLRKGRRIYASVVDGVLQISTKPVLMALPVLTDVSTYFEKLGV